MRYVSRDGLMSSNDPTAVELWEDIGRRMEDEKSLWSTRLRDLGVTLAHPDDGWVDRERCVFTLSSYPQFNSLPSVGDLIAFGWPTSKEYYTPGLSDRTGCEYASEGYRLCRVTAVDVRPGLFGGLIKKYSYYDTGERVPPRAPEEPS